MKLYIIGNGFDRAHDLPTQYWNFRKFFIENDRYFLFSFGENYDIYQGMNDDEKSKILCNKLEMNLANIREDIIIEDAIHIAMSLESGDVGIEDTLYDYFKNEFNYIEYLEKYLKQWMKSMSFNNIDTEIDWLWKIHEDCLEYINMHKIIQKMKFDDKDKIYEEIYNLVIWRNY